MFLLTQYEDGHEGPGWDGHGGGNRRHPELQDKRKRDALQTISKPAFLPVTSRGATPLVVTKKTDCM